MEADAAESDSDDDKKVAGKKEKETLSGKKRKRVTSDVSETKQMKRKRVNSTTSVKSEKSERARTRSMDKGEDQVEKFKAPGKKAEPVLFKRIDESKF